MNISMLDAAHVSAELKNILLSFDDSTPLDVRLSVKGDTWSVMWGDASYDTADGDYFASAMLGSAYHTEIAANLIEELHDAMLSDLDDFTTAYIECALWCTPDLREECDSEPMLDAAYDASDIPLAQLARMVWDCTSFQESNADDLAELDDEQSGHDFWLTRERHGAGFWDRGLGELGMRLSQASRVYGGGSDELMQAMCVVHPEGA